ncbi:MAG: hypothetical protein IID30_13715 [Planctomycetes bacterium]|nr:hypothetical protein [Planctomycetota bacterium]
MHNDSAFRLKRPEEPLPSKADFDPFGGNLDARCAWKHFGGLSIQQAYELFMTNTLHYQEDFMWMGSKAFEYYLPVIDRYLHEVLGDEWDDTEAAILGCGVALQFDWNDADLSRGTVAELEELSVFVRSNLDRFSPLPKEQRRIDRRWKVVDLKITSYRNKSEKDTATDADKQRR